ncbi:MAG: hypothetical protein IT580_15475, partial [Verrucomicrobiales bacterium]|nr:hypothetical protein [Verrucomicrobiales bacterium]
SFRLAGDWMFWTRLLQESDIVLVSRKLNRWRHHGGTVRAFARGAGFGSREAMRIGRHILRHFDVTSDQRRALRRALVCKVWRDVCCAPPKVGVGARARVLADAARFDPRLVFGLVRFGLQRVVARLASRPVDATLET